MPRGKTTACDRSRLLTRPPKASKTTGMRRFPLFLLSVLAACGGGSADEPKAGPSASDSGAELTDQEAWAEERGLEIRRFDLNRDDKPNVFKFIKLDEAGAELVVRKDIDLNNDSRIDIVQMFGDDGALLTERSDLDFDGRPDVTAFFEDGALQRKELDLDYDGRADMTRYYTGGKVERIETDNNGDGRVDTWEYFIEGELDRVGTDNDGDGVVDHWDRRRQQSAPEAPSAGEDGDNEEDPVAEEPDEA